MVVTALEVLLHLVGRSQGILNNLKHTEQDPHLLQGRLELLYRVKSE